MLWQLSCGTYEVNILRVPVNEILIYSGECNIVSVSRLLRWLREGLINAFRYVDLIYDSREHCRLPLRPRA